MTIPMKRTGIIAVVSALLLSLVIAFMPTSAGAAAHKTNEGGYNYTIDYNKSKQIVLKATSTYKKNQAYKVSLYKQNAEGKWKLYKSTKTIKSSKGKISLGFSAPAGRYRFLIKTATGSEVATDTTAVKTVK